MACLKNNETFNWEIIIGNNSIISATGVTVTVNIPLGVSVLSSTSTKGSYNIGTSIWSVGVMAPNAQHKLVLTVNVDDQTLQPYTASAIVAGNEFETYVINNIDSDNKGGPCTDECATGFTCVDNLNSCNCSRIVLTGGACNKDSAIDYRLIAGSEVNCIVILNSVTGEYNVQPTGSNPWSFNYEIYCCCDAVCTGPLTSCQIGGLGTGDCTSFGFIVNSGTTADITDDVGGTANMTACPTDVLHFWSEDGLINVTVAPGSAVVNIQLNLDNLFTEINALPLNCMNLIP